MTIAERWRLDGRLGDAMDTNAVRAAVGPTDELFGRLDILVNNAGGSALTRFSSKASAARRGVANRWRHGGGKWLGAQT